MEGTWLFPPMENDFPDIKFDVAELPQGVEKGNLTFTNAYGMGVDSANKEAGWVLLQYLAGPEGMGKWTSLGLALPSREDVPPAPDREAHVAGLSTARPTRSAATSPTSRPPSTTSSPASSRKAGPGRRSRTRRAAAQ